MLFGANGIVKGVFALLAFDRDIHYFWLSLLAFDSNFVWCKWFGVNGLVQGLLALLPFHSNILYFLLNCDVVCC